MKSTRREAMDNAPTVQVLSLAAAVMGSDLLCAHSRLQTNRYHNWKHRGNTPDRFLARMLIRSQRFRTLDIISMFKGSGPINRSRSKTTFHPPNKPTQPDDHTHHPLQTQTRERRPPKLFLQHNQHMLHHSQEVTYPGPSLITGWRVKRCT